VGDSVAAVVVTDDEYNVGELKIGPVTTGAGAGALKTGVSSRDGLNIGSVVLIAGAFTTYGVESVGVDIIGVGVRIEHAVPVPVLYAGEYGIPVMVDTF
jgi:hypothetical protein